MVCADSYLLVVVCLQLTPGEKVFRVKVTGKEHEGTAEHHLTVIRGSSKCCSTITQSVSDHSTHITLNAFQRCSEIRVGSVYQS